MFSTYLHKHYMEHASSDGGEDHSTIPPLNNLKSRVIW